MTYPFAHIEKKWQQFWEHNQTYKTSEDKTKPKAYILDMFPYPSGAGLHVGHPEGYTATDILCRYLRLKGMNVLHPIGWDAFGLPAERYAMQTNIHPKITTEQNINNFRRQIKMLGLSYDWSREIDTTDPEYYKWTQWIFLQIYNSWYDKRIQKAQSISLLEKELEEFGTSKLSIKENFTSEEWRQKTEKEKQEFLLQFRLVYIAEIPVNWCEKLGTVLANEEVDEWTEKGYVVERRPMKQWMMRITAYSERLLKDLELLDWPASTVEQQRNWIGRSEGAEIDFQIQNTNEKIRVFTTRPDTIFGATYLVLAPEHPFVENLTTENQRQIVNDYKKQTSLKTDLERGIEKDKTGVFTGSYVINPATQQPIPIWIADYVLMGYGTGAIMAVPAHDERDFAFAKKFQLPIIVVVQGGKEGEPFTENGIGVNSSNIEISLNNLPTSEAKQKVTEWIERKNYGKKTIQYKLRDWLFSRQRYWGEPIPIIYWEDGTMSALDEKELPLYLPELEKFQPSGTTESPLALATDWVNVTHPKTGMKGRRETNTMPQWAGSCWYYLRYIDPNNQNELCSKEKMQYWTPVDLYVGGAEHTVLHLLYSRFWHKVLYDLGYVTTPEPFLKLRHQGTILGEDSRKMSKSRGNVVNPDDVVAEYGADSLRLFEMFMGPLEEVKPWSTKGVEGVFRFLNRVWRLFVLEDETLNPLIKECTPTPEFEKLFHQTVKKVEEDITALRFNTAISQMMIFVNEAMKQSASGGQLPKNLMEQFLVILSPFAPHLAEELWEKIGNKNSLFTNSTWVKYNPELTIDNEVTIVVQINGKVRSKFTAPVDASDEQLKTLALSEKNVQLYLDGKQIVKEIFVKNKLVGFVVR